MTLEQLEIFNEIAGGKTYLTVADEMNMSQSSVSRTMRALEEELGVTLFCRDKRTVALTSAGKVLMNDLQGILPKMHQMIEHVQMYTEQKTVTFALVPKTPFLRMNRVTDAFQREMPGCRVQEIQIPRHQDAWDKMRKYQVNFLIMHRPNYIDSSVYFADEFLEDRLMLAMPADHPLADRKSVRPEDIREEFLLLNDNSFYEMMQVSERCGVHFQADYQQLTRIDMLMQVIERKKIAVVWRSEIQLFQFSSLRFLPLDIEPVPFVLVSRRNDMPEHQKKFRACFLKEAGSLNSF